MSPEAYSARFWVFFRTGVLGDSNLFEEVQWCPKTRFLRILEHVPNFHKNYKEVQEPGEYPEVQLKKVNNYKATLLENYTAGTTPLEVLTLHRYDAALNWTSDEKRVQAKVETANTSHVNWFATPETDSDN
ncbi:hypothetical protein Taro_016376 [Colocasia esculenta]|uniref:Uncharacterized protein n=1 Tax=Colocasia esculenta TaxID=4460 RepID=A0A843UNM1_COLES|nr:hypothetical protein [Colocasia esculenta]